MVSPQKTDLLLYFHDNYKNNYEIKKEKRRRASTDDKDHWTVNEIFVWKLRVRRRTKRIRSYKHYPSKITKNNFIDKR